MTKNNFFGAIAMFLLGGLGAINGQVSSYTFTQSNTSFSSISGGTVLGTATANTGAASLYNVSYPVTMPFSFNFNGRLYTEMKISSNGYISFGGTDDSTDNTPISGTENWDGAISAWGRSLNTIYNINSTTGDVRWETVGTAPNREMVIQWSNFRPIYATSTTNVYALSFQVRLKETTNEIVSTYNPGGYILGSTTISGTAQIGLRGIKNTDYNNRLNASTLAFTSSNTGTANSSTQAFSTSATATSGMPVTGLTYKWAPPTCFAPVLSIGTSTANSVTANWIAPIPAAGSYDVYYSTSSSAPSNSIAPSQNNISGTTVTIPSLAPLTTYYVWVRSNCGSGDTSAWSIEPLKVTTLCQAPNMATASGANVCPGNAVTLTATGDTGADFGWYNAAVAGNQLGTGGSFTTPFLTSTTNYWVSSFTGSNSYVGPINPNSLSAAATTTASTTYYVQFEVTNSPVTINSVDVFPLASGQSSVLEILEGPTTFTAVNTINFTSSLASNGTIGQTVPINITLNPGTYRMRLSGGSYYRNYTSNAVFPYSVTNFSITTGSNVSSNSYYFIYNFLIGNKCESARQMVTATVDASACLATSELNGKDGLKVYPNPFSELVTISKPELVKTIKIVDMNGRLIKTIINPPSSVQLKELSDGLYFFMIEMKDGSVKTVKIVKH